MIDSGAKITAEDTDHGKVIAIYPELKPWQRVALILWLILWAMSGLLAMASMLKVAQADQWVYFLVFMSLWAYFLFYGVRSMIWHLYGVEYIRIGKEFIDYKRSWGSFGRAVNYDLQNIKSLGLVNLGERSFAKSYQDAFWTVGGEKIGFEYLGKKVVIGLRLDESQAKQLVGEIQSATKSARQFNQ